MTHSTKETIRRKLYKTMQSEFNILCSEIPQSTVSYSSKRAYEYVFKLETKELFSHEQCQFNLQEMELLLHKQNPLEFLYQVWLDNDLNLNELFADNIRFEIDRLRENTEELQDG